MTAIGFFKDIFIDNRKRNGRRTEDELIADGNWYLLCELVKMMREGKR